MAKVYKAVGGKKIQKFMAINPGVQSGLDTALFKAATKAELILQRTRFNDPLMTHGASIEIEQGNVDRYLILVDKANAPADLNPLVKNLNSALSIEYGRAGGSKTITVRDPDNPTKFIQKKVKWGTTPGLFVLHRAFGVNP